MSSQLDRVRAIVGSGIDTVGNLVSRPGPTDRNWSDPALRNAASPEIIEVRTDDGARLRVHAYGRPNAQPLVLIHGWTCRIEYWNPQINEFAKKFRVIAYDQRGHGHSDMGRRPASAEVLADDLTAVLNATMRPGKRATLVGHSMGGMTIMAWAAKYPELVQQYAKAAVLANTGADELLHQTTVLPFGQAVRKVQTTVGKYVIGAPVPLRALSKFAAPVVKHRVMSGNASAEAVEFCNNIVVACKGRSRGAWGVALAGINVRSGLANLTVPTTVLGGEFDRLTPPAHSLSLADALEQYGTLERLTVFPGVGHMGNVEAAAEFNAELSRVLATRAARRTVRYAGVAG